MPSGKSVDISSSIPAEHPCQIRIYGMTYFDENAEYWGDKIKPVIGAADGRFTARSVKIFGDGKLTTTLFKRQVTDELGRCTANWWCSSAFFPSILPPKLRLTTCFYSSSSHTRITPTRADS